MQELFDRIWCTPLLAFFATMLIGFLFFMVVSLVFGAIPTVDNLRMGLILPLMPAIGNAVLARKRQPRTFAPAPKGAKTLPPPRVVAGIVVMVLVFVGWIFVMRKDMAQDLALPLDLWMLIALAGMGVGLLIGGKPLTDILKRQLVNRISRQGGLSANDPDFRRRFLVMEGIIVPLVVIAFGVVGLVLDFNTPPSTKESPHYVRDAIFIGVGIIQLIATFLRKSRQP